MRSQGIEVPLELDPKSRSSECLEADAVDEQEEEDEYAREGGFEEGEESEAEEDPEVEVCEKGNVAFKCLSLVKGSHLEKYEQELSRAIVLHILFF